MPLSSKLKADYIELINDQLDKIPIESIEEFNVVIQSLQNIISPIPDFKVHEKYKDRMFIIKDYLNSAEDYVELEDDFVEYQQIIKDRIVQKTAELQTLTNAQRNAYIQNYREGRETAAINQQIMAEHLPPEPGSDAHVLSEEEWLADMEDDFENEFDNDDSDLESLESLDFDDAGFESDVELDDSEPDNSDNPPIQWITTEGSVMLGRGEEEPEQQSLEVISERVNEAIGLHGQANSRAASSYTVETARNGTSVMLNLHLEDTQVPLLNISSDDITIYSPFISDRKLNNESKARIILHSLGIPPDFQRGVTLSSNFYYEPLRREIKEQFQALKEDFDRENSHNDDLEPLESDFRNPLLQFDLSGFKSEQLSHITKPECIAAIKAGTLNIPWLAERTGLQLSYITRPECIHAMQGEQPIFTMENLSGFNFEQLSHITKPECIAAIKAGTLNIPWLAERTGLQLSYITRPECIRAMQGEQPIFTMENLSGFKSEQLSHITKPECIAAIQEGIVTLEQLAEMEMTELKHAVQTGDYPRHGNSFMA